MSANQDTGLLEMSLASATMTRAGLELHPSVSVSNK